jgi:hypothetical protein
MPNLPSEFADLEHFSAWCLSTEPERYAKRLNSTMSEMQEFYDAALPRVRDAMTYCRQYQLDALPDDARALMHLMQSLVMVSFPVECWRQPRVPDTGAAYLDCVKEPVI